MPIPSIEFCILCESVRPEPNGKANILGFYGVLPFARIMVPELGKPSPALLFIAGLMGPAEVSKLGARLYSPDGSELVAVPEDNGITLPAVDDEHGAIGGIGFAGLAFPQEGIYRIELFIKGNRGYASTFSVRKATTPVVPATSKRVP